MKTRQFYAAVLLVAALAACKKDKGDDKPKEAGVKVFEPVVAFNTNGGNNYMEVGNQYNMQKGCFMDLIGGRVRNHAGAEKYPNSIDLIYLAPNDGQNAYDLMTPVYSRSGPGANAMWGSNSIDNPVMSWHSVNESEIAVTHLTAADFNNISTNSQLEAAVKATNDFSGIYGSPGGVKLTGKVFAVKLNMDNRQLNALILVLDHLGTSGTNGYLKVMVKVTGIDTNNDNVPDTDAYHTR